MQAARDLEQPRVVVFRLHTTSSCTVSAQIFSASATRLNPLFLYLNTALKGRSSTLKRHSITYKRHSIT